MKIQHISIQNYRCIEALDITIDDYAAFVGANGSGKSSVLYALNWLVNGGSLDAADVHTVMEQADGQSKTISVAVTFGDLTARDRSLLEKYGRGETVTIRRSWTVGDPKSKIVGSALQGPDFITVRSASSVGDARTAYAELRQKYQDLPEAERLASKDDLNILLTAWEDNPGNKGLLEPVDDDEATNFFGFDGQNKLRQCIRVVLIPAASDIASEVAGSKRGSAVNELIGVLMANAGAEAREAWITKHERAIEELTESMRTGVASATGLQAERINERLTSLVSGAALSFTPDIPNWIPNPTPTVTTDVSVDGITFDVSKQGHGIQRAVMIAMFQSLAPDEKAAEQEHLALDDETSEEAAARLERAKQDLPSLVVCIEEPEIYQHPIRARAFARVLVELSAQARVQVIVATHSPYFVKPDNFASLRRFSLKDGKSQISQTSIDAIATLIGGPSKRTQVEKVIHQQLPTAFSEGFFADTVVLVEGDTDKAVIEELAEKLGSPLDTAGISVLDMSGKGNLRIPTTMLQELGIPTYIVADGDALGAARAHPDDHDKMTNAHNSHRADTERLLEWLPESGDIKHGASPFNFEDGTIVCSQYAIWEDDIENELQSWPSFVTAQQAAGHQLRQKDMLAYRLDVIDASTEDVPESLKMLIEAIIDFRKAN